MTDQPTDRAEELRKLSDYKLGELREVYRGFYRLAQDSHDVEAKARFAAEGKAIAAEWARRCAEREAEKATIADYEEVLADNRRLAREIDVAMHGEDKAAKQPSLCDLVHFAGVLRARAEAAEAEVERLRELLADIYLGDRAETGFEWLYSGRSERKWIQDRDAALKPQPQEPLQ